MICVGHNFRQSARIYIQSGDGLHVGGGGTTVRVGKTETYGVYGGDVDAQDRS